MRVGNVLTYEAQLALCKAGRLDVDPMMLQRMRSRAIPFKSKLAALSCTCRVQYDSFPDTSSPKNIMILHSLRKNTQQMARMEVQTHSPLSFGSVRWSFRFVLEDVASKPSHPTSFDLGAL